jgi:methyl-accepting chemotaxis protein
MNEFLIFLALLIPSVVLLIFVLKRVFKSSMLYTFGVIWMITQTVLVAEAYGIGKLGSLYDFIWAFPLGIGLVIIGMIYLAKKYKKVLTDTSENLIRLSEGDLRVELDPELFKRKDEIGHMLNALQKLIVQLQDVVGGVQTGADNVLSASL